MSVEFYIGCIIAAIGAVFLVVFTYLAVRQCWREYRHGRRRRRRPRGRFLYDRDQERIGL